MTTLTELSPAQLAPRTDPAVELTVAIALALHRYGAPSQRLEAALMQCAQHLGLTGQFFALPTSIHLAFGEIGAQTAVLQRVTPGDEDLERLELVDALIDELIAGELSVTRARLRLAAIESRPRRWNGAAMVLSFGIAAGTAARFFGGGWREVAAAFLLGTLTGLLAQLVQKTPRLGPVFEVVASGSAAFAASAMACWLTPLSRDVATLAGLIVLVPGLTLTMAMAEVSSGHLASGTSRLTAALVRFLALGFGTALGRRVADISGLNPGSIEPIPLPDWTLWVAVLGAPVAFTVLLRARPRSALWIALFGLGGFLGASTGSAALGPELGAMVGAVIVGAGSNVFARARNRPASVVQVPAILMLVPGSLGYRSFAALMNHDVVEGVQAAFTTSLVATALVVGLLIGNVLVPPRGAM